MAAAAPVLVGMPAVVSSSPRLRRKPPVWRGQWCSWTRDTTGPTTRRSASRYHRPRRHQGVPDQRHVHDGRLPEHSFTWNVVLLMQQQLANAGVQVHLSRNNDNALGPCVDQRAEMANSLRPNAVVSVHADGGPAGGHGFHVNYPHRRSTRCKRDRLCDSPRSCATRWWPGADAGDLHRQHRPYGRADLTGLNLAQYPSILVECGNMKNPQEGPRWPPCRGGRPTRTPSARASRRSSRPASAQSSASATPVTPGPSCASLTLGAVGDVHRADTAGTQLAHVVRRVIGGGQADRLLEPARQDCVRPDRRLDLTAIERIAVRLGAPVGPDQVPERSRSRWSMGSGRSCHSSSMSWRGQRPSAPREIRCRTGRFGPDPRRARPSASNRPGDSPGRRRYPRSDCAGPAHRYPPPPASPNRNRPDGSAAPACLRGRTSRAIRRRNRPSAACPW